MDNLQEMLGKAEQDLNKIIDKQKQEEAFAVEANARFDKNLQVFQKYYPDIYDVIVDFQTREDFCLHVTDSGHGNFIPVKAKTPLYDQDPVAQSLAQVEKNIAKPFFSDTKYGAALTEDEADERIHIQYMHKLNDLFHQFNQQGHEKLKQLPEHYPTALVFGLGLGYHLPILFDKCQFDYSYICEPDIELFFASLFCIDWASLIEKIDQQGGCLFLLIGTSYQESFDAIRQIAADVGAFSLVKSFCYQHYPSKEVNEMISDFFKRYYETQLGFGFYNDAITGLAHAIINIENHANFFVNVDKTKFDYLDTPVFIIGNGPSLDEAEQFLKQHNNDAIVFSCGTALGSLKKMGLEPDFHVLVERPKITYDILLDSLPKEEYQDLNLLAVDVMYPDVLDLFKWSGLGLKGPEAATRLVNLLSLDKYKVPMSALPFAAPLVANTALSFAVMLGFKNIYLFGVDNGYPVSGESHSKYSVYNDEKLKHKHVVNKNARHKLPGNLGGHVMATDLLNVAKVQMELLTRFAKDSDIFNVGEGAAIEGTVPLTLDELMPPTPLKDKQSVVESVKALNFKDLAFTNVDSILDVDYISEMSQHLLAIAQTPYETREQAAEILKRQARYIYSFKRTKYEHFFNIFKGSLLYFHCPMITLLYKYDDEQASLAMFTQALSLWNDYIAAIEQDFKANWKTKCNWGLEQRNKSKK
ncbi:motility associated factor glycosyltransferase family protein [Thalassotalea sp. LPB0316]|uniref:motility associated factor glycosyltransferase family protein n=1 Tax=Thalassotalea sp. LPB0316 TaxID=2769490 RepID=UPI00186700D1|nr:6-hydroxymethylpterin diphosphokinase MptE-like protein [Thalassotalea sp. LPB0316]QOL27079.1 motility associated factor glycosyltransferase family protein [Thalassotalea sp. LPB0316]